MPGRYEIRVFSREDFTADRLAFHLGGNAYASRIGQESVANREHGVCCLTNRWSGSVKDKCQAHM